MKVLLPFRLLPTSKDKDLRSIVPRTFPDVGSDFSSSGEQEELGEDRSGKDFGEGGFGGDGGGGSDTESKAETEPDVGPTKGLRVAPAVEGGIGGNKQAHPPKKKKSKRAPSSPRAGAAR
jgi:hypothetical protein